MEHDYQIPRSVASRPSPLAMIALAGDLSGRIQLREVTPLLLFLSAREWNCFANSVADVAHGVNERRVTNFLAQPSNKNFH
jgi:hypothetical protein